MPILVVQTLVSVSALLWAAPTSFAQQFDSAECSYERPAFFGLGIRLYQSADERWLTVAYAQSDGPAAQAGLTEGDLVSHVDGKSVWFQNDLEMLEFLTSRCPGQSVRLDIVRNEKKLTLNMVGREMTQDEVSRTESVLESVRRSPCKSLRCDDLPARPPGDDLR